MQYDRITPLEESFSDTEAVSVESLRAAWVDQRDGLASGGALTDFNERLIRRWAIETGILERLYTLDRGTTEILIVRGLDASLVEHGSSDIPATELVRILEDHREAAGYVLDHVSESRDLSLHFVRSLHSLLTRNQPYVEVEDQFGARRHIPFTRGAWKSAPNNPRRPDGVIHAYCPPELVEEEMESLIREYRRLSQQGAPAVIAAAWLHHRFTQIHPFQDGNGRVARALTAFALVKTNCFPIVVDRDQRASYIDSLEAADAGDLRPLVRLFARLEKQELEQALSLSESALANAPRQAGGNLREHLLSALRVKAREKRSAISAQRQRVMEVGRLLAVSMVRPAAEQWASEVREVLGAELPGSGIFVQFSNPTTTHWFKAQLVDVAQSVGYFCDIETFHEWVRIQVRRPGETNQEFSEIIISVHSLGRLFVGVLVASAYFSTRVLDEDDRSRSLAPKVLAERVLTFSYHEDEENVRVRLDEWLANSLDIGLAELLKVL